MKRHSRYLGDLLILAVISFQFYIMNPNQSFQICCSEQKQVHLPRYNTRKPISKRYNKKQEKREQYKSGVTPGKTRSESRRKRRKKKSLRPQKLSKFDSWLDKVTLQYPDFFDKFDIYSPNEIQDIQKIWEGGHGIGSLFPFLTAKDTQTVIHSPNTRRYVIDFRSYTNPISGKIKTFTSGRVVYIKLIDLIKYHDWWCRHQFETFFCSHISSVTVPPIFENCLAPIVPTCAGISQYVCQNNTHYYIDLEITMLTTNSKTFTLPLMDLTLTFHKKIMKCLKSIMPYYPANIISEYAASDCTLINSHNKTVKQYKQERRAVNLMGLFTMLPNRAITNITEFLEYEPIFNPRQQFAENEKPPKRKKHPRPQHLTEECKQINALTTLITKTNIPIAVINIIKQYIDTIPPPFEYIVEFM